MSSQEKPAGGKQYEWQLSDGRQWLRIQNDQVIESHYCQPGAKGISISTSLGKVFIDFDKLQTQAAGLKVQRLSLAPQGHAEEPGWYFRDDLLWREYGSQGAGMSASSVGSRDVERQFSLDPQGSFTFRLGSTGYRLDFSTMTQTNSVTGMRRDVRRRPKFNGSLSCSQLTDQDYKWEFMGDEGVWTEYQARVCSFDSAAIERQYQLNPQGQLHFKTNRFTYTLDFSSMSQVNTRIGTSRTVRRTLKDGGHTSSSSGTAPRWQFQDLGGIWRDYAKGYHQSSTSSQDIERHYQQDPSGTISFTANNFSYELNLSAMTQRNLSTNTTRSVRRLNQ